MTNGDVRTKGVVFVVILAVALHVVCPSACAQSDSVVVFNEIMYHPSGDEARLEWVELFNQMSVDVDLTGWSIRGGIDYGFPPGTIMPAGGYLVIAISPADLAAATGYSEALGPFEGRLSNGGEDLRLLNNNQRLMSRIEYDDAWPWPVACDGSGASLARYDRFSADESAAGWRASLQPGGTPGTVNFPDVQEGPVVDELIKEGAAIRVMIPTDDAAGTAWTGGVSFDDSQWLRGPGGAGYDTEAAGEQAPLVARYYPFDGDALDASGNGIHATLAGPVYAAETFSGGNGQSLRFDGVNDVVDVQDTQNPQSYTLSAWVKVDGVRASSIIVRTSPAGPMTHWSHQVRINASGCFEHYLWDGSQRIVTSPAVVQAGRWYHVAAVATQNGSMHLYVDGGEQGSAVSLGVPWEGGDRWQFGGSSGHTPNFFKGLIDDVAMWHEALSENSIARLADGVSPQALTGYEAFIGLDVGDQMLGRNASMYVRIPFHAAGPMAYDKLTLGVRADDGFVAYLNGMEIARRNAPEPLAWNSAATQERPDWEAVRIEDIDVTSSLDSLRAGENILAIHALNRSASDVDLLIAARLQARKVVADVNGVPVAFHEVAPAGATPFWVELYNYGSQAVDLTGFVICSSGGSQCELSAVVLEPGDYHVADTLGGAIAEGDKLFLYGPGRRPVVDAVTVTAKLQGRTAADPVGRTWFPDSPTPGSANSIPRHDEIVINEIMYHHRPEYATPGTGPAYATTALVPLDATWTYCTDRNPSGDWVTNAYDDSDWPSGQGALGYETASLPEPIRTALKPDDRITRYFRTTFSFDGVPSADAQLHLLALIDDGAVFYLNGVEVHRLNMPSGPISTSTPAAVTVGDATFAVPVTLPVERLVRGKNLLAVEVHQASAHSSDLVMGLELTIQELASQGTAGTPFEEDPEEWIELYNRSPGAVDLSGWRLDEAIKYEFKPHTVVASHAYLVVAKDAAALKQKYPGIRICGDYSGKLANGHEQIVLLDSRGNPADEVHYYDGAPWPQFADGGGSSLELRNPWADNARAEAWKASKEDYRAQWHHYSYTAVARKPVYEPAIYFHEFVMGLLDEGQVLLDNISVVENPYTNPVELIQNGTFEADEIDTLPAKWRIQGTHDRSRVVQDPNDAQNKVLYLVADGPADYLCNHAETTLAGGRTVADGREYRISYDAKWVMGSPQLRTELYYNNVPKTTIVDMPAFSGTPGGQNSTYESNVGPTYSDLAQRPIVPSSQESVSISVRANDPNGVASLTLWFAVDGTMTWTAVPMTKGAGDIYSATIPGHANGTVVQFYVEGRDEKGALSWYPAAGADSRALFLVDDSAPRRNTTDKRQEMRLIMTSADTNFLYLDTNLLSNNRLGATLVYDGREAFYDVGVRLRGSMYSRTSPGGLGYNIRFPRDHLFRGVHESVTTRARAKKEILAKHLIHQAGGVPAMYDDLIYLKGPGGTGMAMLSMARYGDVFLASQYESGEDGTIFKLEGIRVMLTTRSGAPEDLKIYMPVDFVWSFDITDLGDDKELYRWPLKINRSRAKDDYSHLIEMAKVFALTGPELEKRVPEVIDVDEWMRHFALMTLCGIGDIYSFGAPHNLNLYARPSDGEIEAMPWDWDFTFERPSTSALSGDQNIGKIIALPAYTRLFYAHLYDLIQTVYNREYMSYWIDHYGQVAGEDYSAYLSYIGERGAFALGQLPAPIPFSIDTGGRRSLSVDGDTAVITGTAWFNVRWIYLEGSDEPLDVSWLDGQTWQVTLPLDPAANVLTFTAYDFRGNPVATQSVAIARTPVTSSLHAGSSR